MAKRDKQPAPIVRKTARGISAVSGYEAERIMADPMGTEYDLVKRSRRSNPQNGLYWQMLTRIVRATGKWPTPEHLHEELKWICGYRYRMVDWATGSVVELLDSTAFDRMNTDEFRVYFDLAQQKIAEHLGFDPLAFYEAA